MTSSIDITKPESGNATTQSVRDNFAAAKNEIEVLQSKSPSTLPVPISDGGTGSNSAPAARSALGLGSIATQDATTVAITGGDVSGVSIGSVSAATILKVDNIQIDGNAITSTNTNGNIALTPNGSGEVVLDGLKWPTADGSNNQVIATNGSGQLVFVTLSGTGDLISANNLSDVASAATSFANIKQDATDTATGVIEIATQLEVDTGTDTVRAITPKTFFDSTIFLKDLVLDTTPQLGGDLDINTHKIVSVSNNNIELAPNGTGRVILDGQSFPASDGSANQFLKTNGSGSLSWSDILPRGYQSGCKLSNNGTDANNDIDITAGAWRNSDNDGDLNLASGLTKQLDANWVAGTNQGMLDTGSKANSTTYAVFLIKNPTSGVVDILASTSIASPTMPSGYTKKRRIGFIMTDGSGNIRAFFQEGDHFFWVTPTLDISTTTLSTTSTSFALSVPTGMALIAGLVAYSNSTASNIYLSSLSTTDMAPSNSAAPLMTLSYQTSPGHAQFYQLLTNTSQQIRARSGVASSTLRAVTFFYIDRRGRDD